jgi:hypothetical protein
VAWAEVGPAERDILRGAFDAVDDGRAEDAERGLTAAIAAWAAEPPDEQAALFETRARLRAATRPDAATGAFPGEQRTEKRLALALADFDESLRQLALDTAAAAPLADPAALPRTLLARADVNRRLGKWAAVDADLTEAEGALDRLPRVLQTNPYLYQARAAARARLGDWDGAAADALEAEAEFRLTGDKIRAEVRARPRLTKRSCALEVSRLQAAWS